LLCLGACLILAPAANAATIHVDTAHDELGADADCALREAVEAANTNTAVSGCESGDPGEDTIEVPPGTYRLLGSDGDDANQEGDLDITESLAIEPPEIADTVDVTLDPGFGDRSLDLLDGAAPVSVTLTRLELKNGNAADYGGSIRSAQPDSSLTLDGDLVLENRADDDGGAIFSRGDLSVIDTILTGNRAGRNGGAIASRGPLTIDGGQINRNIADGVGGSIDSTDSVSINDGAIGSSVASNGGAIAHRSEQSLTLTDSGLQDSRAITDPQTDAGGLGAALFTTASGPVSIVRSSVCGNTGGAPTPPLGGGLTHSGFAGAIHLGGGPPLTLTDSEICSNHGFNGGAIFTPGSLTATNTRFSSNTADKFGGAIMASAASPGAVITINGGSFEGNESGAQRGSEDSGGAIYAQSRDESGSGGPAVNVTGVSFTQNRSTLDGGAISAADGAAVVVRRSTFDRNTARGGGALDIFANASLELVNSTLVGNRALTGDTQIGTLPGEGGAILVEGDASDVSIRYATIAYNYADQAGGGIRVERLGPTQTAPTVARSVLAFNSAEQRASNCAGPITSGGRNVESQDTCGFLPGASKFDLANTNPLLAALADNGGPAETMGLYAGSAAVDSVPACPPPAVDERGISRPQGGGCDAGAFEGTVSGPRARCAGRPVTIEGPNSPDGFELGDLVVVGTLGNDVIGVAGSNDVLNGLGGSDVICGDLGFATGADRLVGGSGNDRLFGSWANDRLLGRKGTDRLSGGDGNDVLNGDRGRDRLSGGDQDDVLHGGKGRDRLFGGPGDDILFGGRRDKLVGGRGKDRLLPRKPRFPSTITIKVRFTSDQSFPAVYSGRVRSESAACERNRTVVLFNEIFSEAVTTNKSGRWKVPTIGLFGADTYARVSREAKDTAICGAARSGAAQPPAFP
jgi:CSLREA domain-containing protein